ncbi:MAG: hypothetical protein B6I20_11755 [Bacteroidetes bacterium 4572_117]|nr:MAG: hypothetical protein B6I20_11755 [Bacteroidetes bacterium 4572_117]
MVLKKISLLRKDINTDKHLKKLGKLKNAIEENSIFKDEHIDILIREKQISSRMATSLINDSDIVAGIIENLIEVTELLYGTTDSLFESLDVMVGSYTRRPMTEDD